MKLDLQFCVSFVEQRYVLIVKDSLAFRAGPANTTPLASCSANSDAAYGSRRYV